MRKALDFLVSWLICHLHWFLVVGFVLMVASLIFFVHHPDVGVALFVCGLFIFLIAGILLKFLVGTSSGASSTFIPKGFPDGISWQGLGDEPKWEGTLPKHVIGYREPLYVYENGVESEKPAKENGRVIGYRISPTLVIHNMVAGGNGWFREHIRPFIERYGGELLDADDVKVLRQNYQAVDKMRQKIGDSKLPRRFWYKGSYSTEVAYLEEEKDEYDPDCSGIILKR